MKKITILLALGILSILPLAQLNLLPSIVSVGNTIPFADKFGHFFLFGGLALMLKVFTKHSKWEVLGFLGITLFALFDELLQLRLPYRSFNPMDFVAGFAGICVVELLAFWIMNQKEIRTCMNAASIFESHLGKHGKMLSHTQHNNREINEC